MTESRVQEILSAVVLGSLPFAFPREFEYRGGIIKPNGITREEDQLIRDKWATMPGYTSYNDALLSFRK